MDERYDNVINFTAGAGQREFEPADPTTLARSVAGIAELRRKNAEAGRTGAQRSATTVIEQYQAALDSGESLFIVTADDLRLLIAAARSS